ncbi:helix-turn-helix domain-containing protein [Streptomyces lasalocidi]
MEPCRTIELGCDGWLVPQIADQVGCSQKTVRRWLPRARELGIEVSRSRVRRILLARGRALAAHALVARPPGG